MTGLFAAEAGADLLHALQYIAVTYLGLLHMDGILLCHQEESQITHNGCHDGILLQSTLALHVVAYDCHDLVTIDDITVLIHSQQSVCVSIEGQTDIGLFIDHSGLQFFHMGGATVGIDIGTVRIVVDGHHAAAQFFQAFYGCIERGTLCTIHHDLQSGQIHIDRSHGMIDVLFSGIGTVLDLADSGTDGKFDTGHIVTDQCLDLIFHGIGKLIAVTVKEFNTIELYRIVGCGDHNAGIYFVFLGKISNRRSGNHTYVDTVGSYGAGSCHQRIRQHISGNSGITTHHDRGFVLIFLRKYIGTCLPQLHGKQRSQFLVGNSSYTICSKHSSHDKKPLILSFNYLYPDSSVGCGY